MTPRDKLQSILDLLDIQASTSTLDEHRINLMLEKLTKTAQRVSVMGPSRTREPTLPFNGDWNLPENWKELP